MNLAHFVSFNRRSDDGRNATFNERLLPVFSGRSRIFHTGGPNSKGCALIYFWRNFCRKLHWTERMGAHVPGATLDRQ